MSVTNQFIYIHNPSHFDVLSLLGALYYKREGYPIILSMKYFYAYLSNLFSITLTLHVIEFILLFFDIKSNFIITFLNVISSVMKSMHSVNILLLTYRPFSRLTHFRMYCVAFSFPVSLNSYFRCILPHKNLPKSILSRYVYMNIYVVYFDVCDPVKLCRNMRVSDYK